MRARAKYAFEQGRWDWARVYSGQLAESPRDRADALRMLGVSWLSGAGGSLSRGTSVLARYLEMRPGDLSVRRQLVVTLLRSGQFVEAERWAEGLGEDAESLALLSRVFAGQDPGRAQRLAMRALDLDPSQIDAHGVLARLAEARGEFQISYDHALEVIELNPLDARSYGRLLRLERYRGESDSTSRFVEASEIAGRLVQSRDAGRLPLMRELSLIRRLGELIGTESAPLRKRLTELLLVTGRIDEGLAGIRGLQSDGLLSISDRLVFGRQMADLDRFKEARHQYQAVLDEDAGNATARSSVALCDLALGEATKARESMLAAVEEDPWWAGYHAVLGRIELGRQNPAGAVSRLEIALELAPWKTDWRRLLETSLRTAGRARDADRVAARHPRLPAEDLATDDGSPDASVADPGLPTTGDSWFVDVSADAGIDFMHFDGRSGERYYVETTGGGCGFLDFDDDGDLDVYLLTGSPTPGGPVPSETPRNRLYEHRDGRFVDISRNAAVDDDGYGMGMCVGDIDADGRLDFMVANYGPDRLYRNLGNGRFEEVGARAGVNDPRWGSNCAFGDVDGDGDLDLYVSHYLHFDYDDNPKCGDDARGIYAYCRPSSFKGVTDSLFINDGSGLFVEEIRSRGIKEGVLEKGFGVVMTDIDSDRDLDIFVANDSTPNRLYINNGTGVFEDGGLSSGVAVNAEGMTTSGMGVDIADVDGDGLMDIALTNYSMEPNGLYHNLGGTQFADVAAERGVAELSLAEVGWGVVVADFDNDGDRDMVVANGHVVDNIREFEPSHSYEQTNVLLLNDGHGRFVDATVESGMSEMPTRVSRSLAVGDWNNDGRLDLLVSNCNDRFELLENRISNDNHWLGIRLEGRRENRFAIGARAEVTAGGSTQVDEVRSGSSFQAQKDLRLHFGLGGQPGPVEVRIYWPDGSEQTEVIGELDRYVTITQE